MSAPPRPAAGYTIIEVMIAVVFLSLAAAMLLPQFSPAIDRQLMTSARVVAADIDYARNLAISNNSRYQLAVDANGGLLTLTHTGTNSALDTLPKDPFRAASDASDERVTRLATLPGISLTASFVAMYADSVNQTPVTTVEFGPLGETSRSAETFLTLTAGDGDARRFVTLTINPVTGLVDFGDVETTNANWVGSETEGGDVDPLQNPT
ncbi:MAG: hypothetical protein DWQ31_14390 [Planctomycetota bacterium]|nr:MAG: hypothetical protein DWQ31_14390 [Planctomycetota bacterium]REJ94569.1 MAG: hypothetical protein DWQ35_08095 [Planctomycetota bacterium]REK18582.1 MAG: hypothetical protein DWQ42_19375 [Planctomycetota bacterium]REK37477.1 MAG: hypothetical protein DWQ46_21850 [Planctomycetota bacterium]